MLNSKKVEVRLNAQRKAAASAIPNLPGCLFVTVPNLP